jgi:hypothetical protein
LELLLLPSITKILSILNPTFLAKSLIAVFNSQSSRGVCLLKSGTIKLE